MIDKSYSLNKNMISWPESKILRIYQKFHFDSKISCKPSVTVLILITGMSAIFQQDLKQVLHKHCNFIASSLEVVGCGSNEPVYSGLSEPVVHFAPHWFILHHALVHSAPWLVVIIHHRSQTLKSDEAKWPKMTKITPTSRFLRGIPMIWTKTDEATASSASVVATAM